MTDPFAPENPAYGMTALENPSEIGSDLPPGGGRIQMPGGDVRSFQFEIPAGTDTNEALRAAAQRAAQFDAQRRAAEQAAEDEQYMHNLVQNARAEDQVKVVAMARQFQDMRAYQRDYELAVQNKVQPELASALAFARHPGAAAHAGQVAAGFRAAAVPAAPEFKTFNTPTGPVSGVWTGRTFSWQPNPPAPAEKPIQPSQRVSALQREIAALRNARQTASDEDRVAIDADIARMEGVIKQGLRIAETPKLGGKVAATPAAGPSGPINPLPKSKDDLIVGQFYQTSRGVGRWTGDHFEKVAD